MIETTICSLQNELEQRFASSEGLFYEINTPRIGYWSNLDQDENRDLIGALQHMPAGEALRKMHPQLYDVIYSPMRQAGLELLNLKGDEICIDYGCMWGALTIPLAKRTQFVLGIDKTTPSLQFLYARLKESACENVALLNMDLKELPMFENKVDIAIVNGVLEWIPEQGNIELKRFYGKKEQRAYYSNPRNLQMAFLRRVHSHLKTTGKLYLAIENRYDFKMFIGYRDPHADLPLTSFSPRWIADIISKIVLKRPYVNWLYSFEALRNLLRETGFSKVDLYMCFPDYRFPERIIPYDHELTDIRFSMPNHHSRWINIWVRAVQRLLIGGLKLKNLSPSIIAVASK